MPASPGWAIQIMVRLQNHIAAPSAVAAAGPAFGPVGLAVKSHRPFPTVPRARINLDLINEHPAEFKHTAI
jgi:hypothetical protein